MPFLVYRDGAGAQRLLALSSDTERLVIGRHATCDLSIDWDAGISRIHAELQRVGPDWTVTDDGLSRNGTHVNGVRLEGRRRLADGDVITLGATTIAYRAQMSRGDTEATTIGQVPAPVADLTPAQRQVLLALCRPCKGGDAYAAPPTNQEIADDLCVTIDTVKAHLRALFERFGLTDLPQNQKRAKLVELALQSGAVLQRDL